MTRLPPLALKTSARLSLPWLAVAGGLAICAGLPFVRLTPIYKLAPLLTLRVVETVIPLTGSLLAALLFSPESEPALEILLACRRPAYWILVERLLAVALLESAIALCANLACAGLGWLFGETIPLSILRWAAPACFLAGMALLCTQATRQGIYGMLVAVTLWAALLVGGDALVAHWPSLWPVHPFLQPGAVAPVAYFANRAVLLLSGMAGVAWSALFTRDEERLLGIRGGKG